LLDGNFDAISRADLHQKIMNWLTRKCVDGNFDAIIDEAFILKFLPDAGPELEPWKIFAGLDTNGDGELSFIELNNHIFVHKQCKKVFQNLADKNTHHHYYALEDERHTMRITFKHFLTEDGVRLIGPKTDEKSEWFQYLVNMPNN
jgi:hypothetical protein